MVKFQKINPDVKFNLATKTNDVVAIFSIYTNFQNARIHLPIEISILIFQKVSIYESKFIQISKIKIYIHSVNS